MISGAMTESNNFNLDLSMYPPKDACTLEMCAGIVDKDLPLNEIAREEILEECGYNVTIDRVEEVMRYRSGVGATGALQVLFYCEVRDEDQVSGGGGEKIYKLLKSTKLSDNFPFSGIDDEIIEVLELSIDEARQMMVQGSSHPSPPSFLFSMLWFLTYKAPKHEKS